ncbi:MAG: hypothetical protein GPJ28_01955 [Microcystis aeruginosa L211-11]|nr:hypothetical protein [Microcystis aeruginosa L211-11]
MNTKKSIIGVKASANLYFVFMKESNTMKTQSSQAQVITRQVTDLADIPDILSEIRQETVQGIIIKQVFSQREMQQLAQYVQSLEAGFFPTRYGKTYGLSLSDIEGNKANYLDKAEQFRKMLIDALPIDFEARITQIFKQLSNGRAICCPQEDAKKYTPATIRFVPPNQPGIVAHVDSEFTYSPNYSYLHQIADVPNCFSYFIVVNKPTHGGELILHQLYFNSDELKNLKTGLNQFIMDKKQNLNHYSQQSFELFEGDLVIFKSSTITHEIAYVSGAITRITIGGFLSISHDNQKIYYWS